MRFRGFACTLAVVLTVVAPALAQLSPDDRQTSERIHKALLRLPYYGVFDFLAFRYEKGTVALSGFAYRPQLKRDAANAVRRVARVDQVVDTIEELPVSTHDDGIRWATFYALYYESVLSRYAPGGGLSGFDRRFEMLRFPGMQPLGMYSIHIVVNRGNTLLIGAVDSELDRTVAGLRAREVPGVFGVENAIEVAGGKKTGGS